MCKSRHERLVEREMRAMQHEKWKKDLEFRAVFLMILEENNLAPKDQLLLALQRECVSVFVLPW